jgi:hypothetical protein
MNRKLLSGELVSGGRGASGGSEKAVAKGVGGLNSDCWAAYKRNQEKTSQAAAGKGNSSGLSRGKNADFAYNLALNGRCSVSIAGREDALVQRLQTTGDMNRQLLVGDLPAAAEAGAPLGKRARCKWLSAVSITTAGSLINNKRGQRRKQLSVQRVSIDLRPLKKR